MKRRPGDSFNLRVPGSIANLGPGFDTLALAVQLYLDLDVRVVEGPCATRYHFSNRAISGENYVARAFEFLSAQREALPYSLDVTVRSDIPMKSGLGSSAAATVAGLRLYEAIAEAPLPAQGLLNAACALEGHPDNVAAALLGGLTVSCQMQDRSTLAVRMAWPPEVELLVLTPEFELSTALSRGILPSTVSLEDAVFNLQRVGLFLHAIQSGKYELLREALGDRLHQPQRSKLVPGLTELLGYQHPDLLGVCLSGAGPSILAFAYANVEEIIEGLAETYRELAISFQIRRLQAHQPEL